MSTSEELERTITKLLNDYFFIMSRKQEDYNQQQKRLNEISEYANEEYNMDHEGTKLIFRSIISVANTHRNLLEEEEK